MFIFRSVNIGVSCCFIFCIVILNPTASETTVPQYIGENENCRKEFKKSGEYPLDVKNICGTYHVNLDFEKNTSIVNLTISINHATKVDEESIENAEKSTFDIELCELPAANVYECKGDEVLTKKWHQENIIQSHVISHLTRSSKVSIKLSGTGNWSYYEIKFSFKEIPYRPIKLIQTDANQTECSYTPNSVSLLRLQPQTTYRGIEISFRNLKINADMGEYILIGTGTEPHKSTYSQPLYITQVTEDSKFYVDDSRAFVAFVAGSFQDTDGTKDFKILWKFIKENSDDGTEGHISAVDAYLICFYNYSEASKELKKNTEEQFKKFREYFVEIAKEYLPEGRKHILNNRSILLFGESQKPEDVLRIFIKVIDKEGKSVFTWSTLQTIVEKLEENPTHPLGYKVGKCSQTNQYSLPYKVKDVWIYYGLFILLSGFFPLMLWAWKHKMFTRNCLTEKEEKLTFGPIHAEPNPYDTTTPKMMYEDGGRREVQPSLIQSSLQEGIREDPINTTTVEMNNIPSTSHEQDTLARYLSSKRSRSRPSLKSLLDNAEEIKKLSQSSGKTEGTEADHLYDSVSSSNQLNETKL